MELVEAIVAVHGLLNLAVEEAEAGPYTAPSGREAPSSLHVGETTEIRCHASAEC